MLKAQVLKTDILIIGGGAAGCFSAITLAEHAQVSVIIAEKAHIKRSGCLAAGVNALNAYITEGESPESFVDYVNHESAGVIRQDLVYSIAKNLNRVTRKIEKIGLTILRDESGSYAARGRGSIKINGENIKPLLAKAVESLGNVKVLNRVNMTDYIIKDGRVIGATGFSLTEKIFYVIYAKAVICTTGGAAGLYRPNNPGFSRHKMWYSPFNTGAGYAMGIRAGAEMTSFEMRFVALRCKDTIAPTGTIAQGVKAAQVNSRGERYLTKYKKATTPMRILATVEENSQGRGPCYLATTGITKEQEQELFKAYLNMAPAQTLHWIETGKTPGTTNVEIEGTEPYVVGGHAASGYWVDINRATTLPGLFAAGDVAGGSPKKYVTGSFAEGEIAALSALNYIGMVEELSLSGMVIKKKLAQLNRFFENNCMLTIDQVEEAMQKVMDQYAGGISTGYVVNEAKLRIADESIAELLDIVQSLKAHDLHDLLSIHEIIDRLYVCKVLVAHLLTRRETRWPCYQQNADYPKCDNLNWQKYVNSRYENGVVKMIIREIVQRDEKYEHMG